MENLIDVDDFKYGMPPIVLKTGYGKHGYKRLSIYQIVPVLIYKVSYVNENSIRNSKEFNILDYAIDLYNEA